MTWTWPLPDRYPLLPSGQGAFGAERRHDRHTGVDLYAPEGHRVVAVEPGRVVALDPAFTGGPDSSWWNQTSALLVEGPSGVVLYGEIFPFAQEGTELAAGDLLGEVRQVLREKPGKSYPNPTSMLHLELYAPGSREALWWRGVEKPAALLDPTPLLREVPVPQGVVPAAVAVILDDQGRLLLLRRFPHDRTAPGLCLPGGKLDAGESLPQGLAREVLQETGLEVRFLSYVHACRVGRFDVHAVRAIPVGGALCSFPSAEHAEALWLYPEEALALDLAGPMTRSVVQHLHVSSGYGRMLDMGA